MESFKMLSEFIKDWNTLAKPLEPHNPACTNYFEIGSIRASDLGIWESFFSQTKNYFSLTTGSEIRINS